MGVILPNQPLVPPPSERSLATTDNATTDDKNYNSSCQISNDPADGSLPEIDICNVTAYACTSRQKSSLLVEFDYDVVYNPQKSLEKVLAYVEENVLDHLAHEIGVSDCEVQIQPLRRRRRRLSLNLSDDHVLFDGISLDPRDLVDPRYDTCVISVEDTSLACVPVQGGVSVYVHFHTADEATLGIQALPEALADEIRTAVLSDVQRGMESDFYAVPGSIQRVNYIGNRSQYVDLSVTPTPVPVPLPVPVPVTATAPPNPSGLTTTSKTLISVAAVLAFLLCASFLVLRKRRRDKPEAQRGDVEEPGAPLTWDSSLPDGSPNDKSLADRDSLALEPQTTEFVEPPAPFWKDNNSFPDFRELTPPSQSPFSRSLESFDVAMNELDEIAGLSPNASSQESISRYQFSYDAGGGPTTSLEEPPVPDGFSETVPDVDYCDSNSENTPRRVLQMT